MSNRSLHATGTRIVASLRPRRLQLRRPRLATALVIIILVVQVYPILWIFLSSLRPAQEFAGGNPFSLPHTITLANYQRALAEGDLGRYTLNSLIVTCTSSVLIVVLGMMAAYAIQVLGFRFNRVIMGAFVVGIIVPVQVVLVPLFITYNNVGIIDSYTALILPMVGFGLPMSVYLFVGFFSLVSREIYEAAIMDGCNAYRTFLQILAPMSINTIITVIFVNAIFIWNDFIFANTFILSHDLKTIPLGLQDYMGERGAQDWTAQFAAVSITLLPLLLFFLLLNRPITYGLENGATKG